ncbi:tetratricopeptide repeat protein [Bacillus pumilus]|uniref:tetratricopeptide repeat protein n=1 Tax=Bacillus pumilus TaxID=1408 RepID=UPI0033379E3A
MDILDYEGALSQFKENLRIAQKINKEYLEGTSYMNLGICFNARGDYEAAESYLKCALEIFEEGNRSFLPKTIFNMAHVLCKDNRTTEDKVYVKKVFLWLK